MLVLATINFFLQPSQLARWLEVRLKDVMIVTDSKLQTLLTVVLSV